MRILTPTIIANNESQPSTAGALLRIHDQDATSGESLLIVSSDDSDYYFKVASNGRVHFRGNATDGDGQIKVHLQHSGFTGAASSLIWDSSGGANQMSIRQSEENSDLFVYAHAQSLNLAEFARTTADVTFNAQVTVNGQGSDILDLYDNAATPVNVFKVQNDGAVHLGAYGSGTFTGTAAYTLAVDSSGNVIEITPTDANTTYDLTSAQSGTDVDITLTGSDATTDTVTLVAGDAITLTDDGSNNVTIATDGTAESTHIAVKNTSGSTITKGTPVYITGNVGSSDRLQIAPADASDSAKMPAVGLLETDLINNAEGYVVQGGYLRNITTDATIDGTSTSSNDTVYVKAGGGITMTKPTGSTNYIQNIAKVARVGSASSGSLIVSSILRTNDIPNLADGQVWVGSTTYPVSTDFNLQEVTDGGNTTTNDITIGGGGTTATDAVLILDGGNASGGEAYISLQRNSVGGFLLNHSDSSIQVRGTTDLPMYFYTNNSIKQTILSNGNIGIGTSTPSATFVVQPSQTSFGLSSLNSGQIALGNNASNTIAPTIGSRTTELNQPPLQIITGQPDNSTKPSIQFSVREDNNTDFTTLSSKVAYQFLRYLTPLMSIMRNGAVGIGTSTPSARLDIEGGAVRIGGNAPTGSVASFLYLDAPASKDSVLNFHQAGSQVGKLGYDASLGGIAFVAGAGSFATADAVILDNGNIGIGTTSPSEKLEVAGNILLTTNTGASRTLYTGGDTNLHIQTNTGDVKILSSNGGNNLMTLLNGGNIGINESSPDAKLHIVGSGNTSGTTALLVENSSGDDLLQITDGGNAIMNVNYLQLDEFVGGRYLKIAPAISGDTHKIESNSGSDIVVSSSNGNTLIIGGDGQHTFPQYTSTNFDGTPTSFLGVDASGNVVKTTSAGVLTPTLQEVTDAGNGTTNSIGIGTSTPSAKLHVQRSDDGGIGIFRGTSNAQLIIGIDSSNLFYDASNGNANHVFKSNDIERMRITSTGAVGIGTSTPSGRVNIQSAAASTYLLNLDYSDGTDGGGFYEASSTDLSLFLKNSSGTNTVTIATDGDSFLNGGNVGIGTSTPVGKLTVNTGTSTANLNISNQENGSISFHNNATNKGFPTIVGKSNDGAGLNLISATNDTNSNWDMQFNVRENDNSDFTTLTSTAFLFSRSSTKLLTILRNGAVGIGTSSPSYNLDIESSTAQLRIHSTTNNAVLRIESPNTKESKIYFGNDSQV
jgi:hypothetical protein